MLASSSSTMSNNGSYGNERTATTADADYNMDPASGSFFHLDYKKHDDLKEMLDSSKDSLKLEAMKRIIGMVAKGRDASELFPAVVKNVVSKNIEVKKLVYVYLVRYAEEQQDLVLLSISTFQRALKEPNQLIRASALRVLSSIRVTMIVPIVMLAIRDAAADMSPYVRKTAAHAIPKLYSLDPEQKPELVSIIERLLADRTTLVVGSAVMAFTEVCPERSDLIHKVYRKLCTLLVDVDEWGQIVIINMLTRYARTQFADPNFNANEDQTNSSSREGDSGSDTSDKTPSPSLDPDHRLLLRSVRPLLQSRNAAVVMAVAQLYHHTAPAAECQLAARALVRLLRSHTEVQTIVLDSIASITVHKKRMFEPYLKSFFVRTSDLTRIKLLKLDILTNLATESNVFMILRELRTYLFSSDKLFVAATIQAIGRCACSISEVTDSCLNGLVTLLSSKDEAIVAESVVVIKRLLQTRATEPQDIITQMAKLLDSITVAQARAAILWLLGEYSQGVTYIAPDVLRKIAKSFCLEHDIVKLQALNLAVKLYITNGAQTKLLCQYLFSLARYDQNYDVRDRARLLKYFCQTWDKDQDKSFLAIHSEKIFLTTKPAPMLQSRFKDRVHLQLGSLSHYINVRANGYQALPAFPSSPPSGSVRNVDTTPTPTQERKEGKSRSSDKKDMFFWESGSSSPAQSSASEESSESETEEENQEEESTEDSSGEDKSNDSSEESQSSSKKSDKEEENNETSDEGVVSDSDTRLVISNSPKPTREPNPKKEVQKTNLDLLLDLDADISCSMTPAMTPSLGGFLTPLSQYPAGVLGSDRDGSGDSITPVSATFIPTKNIQLLDRISGRGLSLMYRFTRSPHLFSTHMVNIGLTFTNSNQEDITDIKVGKKMLPPGMTIHDFACIATLAHCCTLPGTLGIDFNDSTQPAKLEIVSSVGTTMVSIKPTIGELLRPVRMSEDTFNSELNKLRGMNEHSVIVTSDRYQQLLHNIYQIANVNLVPCSSEDVVKFAAQTLTSNSLVLVTIANGHGNITVTVNCEKIVVGSMLLNDVKTAISHL